MGTTNIGQIHDTTIFNNTLEALDTGKIVYILGYYGWYSIITDFIIINSDGILSIEFNDNSGSGFVIYPSEGYNASDLYTPTNLVNSEDDSSEAPSVT